MTYDYDLFVIGAGPGGLTAAKRAATYGVRVAIAEQESLGGTCANRGCVPKKLMVYASDFAALHQDSVDYGWERGPFSFNWPRFRQGRDRYLEQLQAQQERALAEAGIAVFQARARFRDPHTLEIEGQTVTANKVLIAVGGRPSRPPIPGIELAVTSREMFALEHLPQRLAIIGGGYIGVEFASILCNLGTQVTLMNQESCLLEGFDEDLQTAVRQGLRQRGVRSLCNTTTQAITQKGDELCLQLTGDCSETLTVDTVLCATGRIPNIEDLGLERVGVQVINHAIAVDEFSRTRQPNIFAIGDCTNRKQLTPVARAEGRAFADSLWGNHPCQVGYEYVPTAVCSQPEAAMVGLTEAEARSQYGAAVHCIRTEFQPLAYSLTQRDSRSLIKIVVDGETDRVVGIHMVGDHAAEIVQSLGAALQIGTHKRDLNAVIGIHPSSTEELFLQLLAKS